MTFKVFVLFSYVTFELAGASLTYTKLYAKPTSQFGVFIRGHLIAINQTQLTLTMFLLCRVRIRHDSVECETFSGLVVWLTQLSFKDLSSAVLS